MTLEKLKYEDIENVELNKLSVRVCVDFFHILSLIYSGTTRKHTPEFVLYKTREMVQNTLPWINAQYDVDDNFVEHFNSEVHRSIDMLKSDPSNIDGMIEFIGVRVMSQQNIDVLDILFTILGLVISVYNFTLEQIFEF